MTSHSLASLGSRYALRAEVMMTRTGPIGDAVLAVDTGTITYAGPAAGYAGPVPVTDLGRVALTPGMLDIHHHVIEPFAKALTGGEPAQLWKRFWLPLEAATTPESAYDGAKWTFAEALRGGITTIVEHGIRSAEIADGIHRAAEDAGIRLVSSTGAYDLKNFDTTARTPQASASIDAGLAIAEAHVEACKGFTRVVPSLACGTVQSNSQDMIRALSGMCRDRGLLFQIHANEHTPEVHACIEATGRRPIQLLHDLGVLGPTVLIAHATLATAEEIALLAATDTAVAYNPVASLWKGNNVAPVLDFIAAGVRFGLGSDATRNDGFRMLDAAEACQRIAYGMPRDDFSCGAGWRWTDAAFHGGADAAMLGDVTGALEVGKQADFLVLDRRGPEVRPSWDFTWELVRCFDRADILATFVDGAAMVVNGRTTRFDLDAFIDAREPHGRQAIVDAELIRLHGPSDGYRTT